MSNPPYTSVHINIILYHHHKHNLNSLLFQIPPKYLCRHSTYYAICIFQIYIKKMSSVVRFSPIGPSQRNIEGGCLKKNLYFFTNLLKGVLQISKINKIKKKTFTT